MKGLIQRSWLGAAGASPSRVFAAVFLLAALVFFLRFPSGIREPQFRVEDGNIFFMEEALHGIETFTFTYNGYLHTIQRAIAWLGGQVHPRRAPAFYNWSALLVTAAVCARIAVAGIPAPWRLSFAALFILQPLAGWQAVNVTNLFWFTAALLPVLAIERAPASRSGRALTLAVAAVLGLSGPFSFFFAPLFVLRLLLLERKWYDIALLATLLATAAVQAALSGSSARVADLVLSEKIPGLADLPTLANRLLVSSFFTRYADETSTVQRLAALGVAAVFLAGCIAAFVRGGSITHENARRLAMIVLGAVSVYAAGILGSDAPWASVTPFGEAQRYYILPCLLFAWIVFALACAPGFRWTRVPAAALILSGTAWTFRDHPRHSLTWEQDFDRMEARGFGMLRVMPYGSLHSVFLAKGEGRHGFARGARLRELLDQREVVDDAFGLELLWARSQNAFTFLFPDAVAGKPCMLVYPNSMTAFEIPPGAVGFRGACGYSPLALSPTRLDRVAGGDGFLFVAYLEPEEGEAVPVLSASAEPGPVDQPPVLRSFAFRFPPGRWKSIVFQHLQGPSPRHTTEFDFALWSDFAFEFP